jgi:cytochrome c peroxidase
VTRLVAVWLAGALPLGCSATSGPDARRGETTVAMEGGATIDGAKAGPEAGGADGGVGVEAGGAEAGSVEVGASPDDPDPTFTQAELAALAALSPSSLPPPPPDVSNAHADDPTAAAFGQKLFFTSIFAGPLLDGDNDGSPSTLGVRGQTGKVACAGCHLPGRDFSDTRSPSAQISLASGWGRRRAPSLLDIGQATIIMWDGRRDALYNQVFGPIESVVEMNSSRLYAAEQIFHQFAADYEGVFGPLPPLDDTTRFPPLSATVTGCQPAHPSSPSPTCDGTWHGSPGDHAEFDGMAPADQDAVTRVIVNVGKAIGAYERLLTCGPGRFDQWMHGDAGALSRAEQRGAEVFVGPGKCVACHSGPFLSDQAFHDVGLVPATVAAAFIDANDPGAAVGLANALADPLNTKGAFSDGDDGRLPASVPASMQGAFRSPTLRCVARRPSFFHTGQTKSLAAVVAFFDAGGDPAGGYVGTSEVAPLGLTALQKSDLVAFLGALDGPGASASLTTPP